MLDGGNVLGDRVQGLKGLGRGSRWQQHMGASFLQRARGGARGRGGARSGAGGDSPQRTGAKAKGGEQRPAVSVSQPLQRQIVEWDEYTGRFDAVATVEVRARVSGY